LIELLHDAVDFFLLAPNRGGLLRLSKPAPDPLPVLYFRAPHEFDALLDFLRAAGIERVHYHHTVRLDSEILKIPQKLGLPYDYTVHDYYSFCPQVTLTTTFFRYCGEPSEPGCNKCLQIRPTPSRESIEHWRSRHRAFVERADRVFVPSPSVERRIRRHFPAAAIIFAPHPEPISAEASPRPVWTHTAGALRIVVIGALSPIKGADLLESAAIDAARRGLALEFHLVGDPYRSLSHADGCLLVHGKYRDNDLHSRLDYLSPHLAWFPSQCPETYSYTLSAILRTDLPAATTTLGGIHDRLAGRELSWALPWESSACEWNDFFVKLRSNPLLCKEQLICTDGAKSKSFSYPKDYLPRRTTRIKSNDLGTGFQGYRSPLRVSPEVFAQYMKGYARLCLSTVYRFPGIRRVAVTLLPEHRLHVLRRRLDRF
jgi:hypothetical protein